MTDKELLEKQKQDIAYYRLSFCKIIDKFMNTIIINGNECFHNNGTSAGKATFIALGIEDDYINKQDFYRLYDKCEKEYRKAYGYEESGFSHEQHYLKELAKKGKTIHSYSDIMDEEYNPYTNKEEGHEYIDCDTKGFNMYYSNSYY